MMCKTAAKKIMFADGIRNIQSAGNSLKLLSIVFFYMLLCTKFCPARDGVKFDLSLFRG